MKTASTLYQLPISKSNFTVVRMGSNGTYEYQNLNEFLLGKELTLRIENVNTVSNLVSNNGAKTAPAPAPSHNAYGPVASRKFSGTIEIPQEYLNWLGVGAYDQVYVKSLGNNMFIVAVSVTDPSEYMTVNVSDTGRLRIGKQNTYKLFTGKRFIPGAMISGGKYTVSRGGANNNTLIVSLVSN